MFFSTHLIHEVERVADWVGVLDEGRLLWSGPLEDLKGSVKRLTLAFDGDAPRKIPLKGVLAVSSAGRHSTVVLGGYGPAVLEAARAIAPQVTVEGLALEEILLAMLGKGNER